MSHKITVVGSGFAALTAARHLRSLDRDARITLVAPRPEFVYLPSLIWLPTGQRQAEDIVRPLEGFFERHRIRYHQGSATGLDLGGRLLLTDNGEVENDAILIGTGGRFLKKLPGIEHAITPCEGVESAMRIKMAVENMDGGHIAFGFSGNPREGQAMRGGPMFEFLFGIDSLLRKQGRRDRFELTFFSPAPEPGKRLGPRAVGKLLGEMNRRGIHTHLGHKLKSFSEDKVSTEGGEFPADLILFMPGMTGNPWFDNTELSRSDGGLLKADAFCRVEGAERVYVAGDAGSFPGPDWMPKQAHMADLQAAAAAKNMHAELNGREPEATFKAELMCIVDSMDKGMLVARSEKRNWVLPRSRLWHWSKSLFEKKYLRQYR
ncbi:NAD(P)/FAD-dependent oxidoreductase [Natronospira bacteriovora]|uniref:FAD-dependent oxidoreductase n=1 Tax=Natronospira bacteriovora TaxID=3069753 RepID=A0ABU0W4Z9_9GAMM|nr:FAD-dependent oxidoreductase [Natronospira sp. AB-CW4]MDQ2069066.1 FAD-dependent oxidoreductase [Natronospira sp. AB-CW4]